MIKRPLLMASFTALLALGACAQSRSLETAQKTPALTPEATTISLDLPSSSVSVSTMPAVDSGMQLAIDQY
ncbi:MAG: hypothetical protein CMJ29_03295 [Phycisphaerae bacterium]|nr:hypothetical protein [Phycisphaerae bacterium]